MSISFSNYEIDFVRRIQVKYPQGSKKQISKSTQPNQLNNSYSNRGKSLEDDINITNKFYLDSKMGIIHKKPTPIQIVKVHYPKRSAAVITEGYFQAKSTTDYNGIYQGKHLDFEAKETKNKTLFPLSNIHDHQFEHMQAIIDHGGICFFIIRFTVLDETFFIPAENVLHYWKQDLGKRTKSIPYETIKEKGVFIPFKYQARVDYLKIVNKLYF